MGAEPDAFLGGRLRLRQPPRGAHRAGTDAVLLARLLAPAPGATLYDLGAATGAVGLAVARLTEVGRVVLVERDPGLAALARDNVSANGLDGRVVVIEADLLAPGAQRRAAGLAPESADIVLTNPPFFEAGTHRASPVPLKAAAHTFAVGGLDLWLRTCADLLRPGGRLVVQAGSPYFAPQAFWCIAATVASAGLSVTPYHVDVPSFGDWGFVLAARGAAPVPSVDPAVADELRFLDGDVLAAATVFPKDRSQDRSVEISTLDRPRILQYEARGWRGY